MEIHRIHPAALGAEPPTYTHGIKVRQPEATLYISGQVGVDAQGVASSDFATQAAQVWSNIGAILGEAGMEVADIVKLTTFLVDRADFATFVEVRRGILGTHKPASTVVYVSGLVKPEWKLEVEVVAVR